MIAEPQPKITVRHTDLHQAVLNYVLSAVVFLGLLALAMANPAAAAIVGLGRALEVRNRCDNSRIVDTLAANTEPCNVGAVFVACLL